MASAPCWLGDRQRTCHPLMNNVAMTASTAFDPATLQPQLQAGLRQMGLDAALAGPLLVYLGLLHRWNGTYNLTAVRDPQAMVARHLLDSLTLLPALHGHGDVADLGSGAGLPGIPLAIARPDLQVTLVESNGKKTRFLREVVRQLGLDNVRVLTSRIEQVDEAGRHAVITARALATLSDILRLGGHLLAPDGLLLAMKGAWPQAELDALPAGWRLLDSQPLQVPGEPGERHLLRIGRAPAADRA